MLLSRNDLRQRYAHSLTLHIPKDSPLWAFITEEQAEDETLTDTVTRLLTERLDLSRQGF
jgi:hypothetical protein